MKKINLQSLLFLLSFIFFAPSFTSQAKEASHSQEEQCQWGQLLKELGKDEKDLILKQTQITALKLSSLINLFQSKDLSTEERKEKMESLRKMRNPLPQDHKIVQFFKRKGKLKLLEQSWESLSQMLKDGRLSLTYSELPLLLMTYESTTQKKIFDDRDFATAWFWHKSSESRGNQSEDPTEELAFNPMVKELKRIYDGFSKVKKERLYQEIHEDLQNEIEEIMAHARQKECDLSQLRCESLDHFNLNYAQMNSLNDDLVKIASFQLSSQINDLLKDHIKWELHPPQGGSQKKEEELLKLSDVPTKIFDHEVYRDYRAQKKWIKKRNQSQDELSIIKAAHELEGKEKQREAFLVLDKGKERLFLYDKKNKLMASFSVPLKKEPKKNDRRTKKKFPSAGIFSLHTQEGSRLEASDQRGFPIEFLATEAVDCTKGEYDNCVQTLEGLEEILGHHSLKLPLPLYVLPKDEDLQFVIKNNQLSFTTYKKKSNYFEYNFSPKSKKSAPLKFVIGNKKYATPFAQKFLKSLELEKENLMKIYKLDNDEYNDLCILAFGILGQESQFGTHWRYHVKERYPGGVAYIKRYKKLLKEAKRDKKKRGLLESVLNFLPKGMKADLELFSGKLSTSRNSRGPTQIKRVPKLISRHYGIRKEDLQKPDKAAIATLGFLAQSLKELKAKEKFHPAINGKNRLNYLHYIYMGKSAEIIKGTATPEKNIYFRNVRNFASDLQIWQKE